MRAERMDGIASKHRDDSVEDNLAHFAEMKTGSPEGQRWCLRAKISVDDNNKALRDPVIFRVQLKEHHRTGYVLCDSHLVTICLTSSRDQWKIYPTYDFACPIVDALEGVTHALRTIEYRDRNPQYHWMIEALELRKVKVWDFRYVPSLAATITQTKCSVIPAAASTLFTPCFLSENYDGSSSRVLSVAGMILVSLPSEVN